MPIIFSSSILAAFPSWSLFAGQEDDFCNYQGSETKAARKMRKGGHERQADKRREKEREKEEDRRRDRTRGKQNRVKTRVTNNREQAERRRVFTYLLAWRTRLPSRRKAWQLARICSFCSSCSALLSCTVLACGPPMWLSLEIAWAFEAAVRCCLVGEEEGAQSKRWQIEGKASSRCIRFRLCSAQSRQMCKASTCVLSQNHLSGSPFDWREGVSG